MSTLEFAHLNVFTLEVFLLLSIPSRKMARAGYGTVGDILLQLSAQCQASFLKACPGNTEKIHLNASKNIEVYKD